MVADKKFHSEPNSSMPNDTLTVVVVGGGQAGAQVCQSLRQFGYAGPITLIGDEPALPYQRPPLSKAYLKGDFDAARLYLRTKDWYDSNEITLQLNQSVTAINPVDRVVRSDTVGDVPYTHLVLATGSRPRPVPMPGADLENVYDLRTIADIDRIRPTICSGKRACIVGAGYIGLEAAAVLRQMGMAVTVLERAGRVLERVTGEEVSDFFTSLHQHHGVEVITNASVASFHGTEGRVTGVALDDGTVIECDIAITGIGILPNVEIAAAAGLTVDNGISVDASGRTSDPHIFAAGDCTSRPLLPYGRTGRLESVHNAIEQGKAVAAAIAGRDAPPADCPWFWSDQYDVKLQIAGLSAGHDDIVVRGSPADHKFSVFYFAGDTLVSADAINSPPDFMMSKKMILAAATPNKSQLADLSKSIKDITLAALT